MIGNFTSTLDVSSVGRAFIDVNPVSKVGLAVGFLSWTAGFNLNFIG